MNWGAVLCVGIAAFTGFDTAFACAIGTSLVLEWPGDVSE